MLRNSSPEHPVNHHDEARVLDATTVRTAVVPAANSAEQAIPAANSLALATIDDLTPVHGANRGDAREDDERPVRAANKRRLLDDVISEVRSYQDGLQEIRVPISQLRVNDNRVIADEQEFDLDPNQNTKGFQRACNTIKAPPSYLERLDPHLRGRNLEYGFQTVGAQKLGLKDENSTILSRDGRFVGFGRSDLHTLPGPVVLDALHDGLGDALPGVYVQNFSLDDEGFSLDVASNFFRQEVRIGDAVEAGIHLEHSLLGEQATLVTAFIVRLRCANGMTHRECVGARRTPRTRRLDSKRGDAGRLQYEQVRSPVASTKARLGEKLEAIRMLGEKTFHGIDDVNKIMEHFLRRSRMYSDNLMQQLRRAWTEELGGNQEFTYVGVLNSLTWLATHADQVDTKQRPTERQLRALSAMAGIFAYQRVHICPSCFSVFAGARETAAPA